MCKEAYVLNRPVMEWRNIGAEPKGATNNNDDDVVRVAISLGRKKIGAFRLTGDRNRGVCLIFSADGTVTVQ